MANLEVLALDTAVPQIRAPGAGDGYSVPRDMTLASGTVLSAPTVDATNVEVTNLKAKDGTAAGSIADSTGVVTIGSSVLTTTDINGGTIDGTTIGGSSAAAGTFTTVTGTSVVNALGAVGTPSYTFTGDLNTGMWSPTADTVAWSTGGSERMRLDTSGNLGIGTASPDAKLTVSGGAASFADGTSSAPAIANAGDLDTGVYFPAADEMAVTTGGTVAAAFNSNGLFFRNRVINGDMRIDQRNAGAAVTTSGSFVVDRFGMINTTDGAFSAQQDTSVPSGFVNSAKVTTTTADATLTTTQNLNLSQPIEGTNVADLAWGTANARTVTLSFWVRSSLTGTFGGSLRNNGATRSYPFTYSISVADTWEYKSVTIPGDTSGTWLTTTGIGINVTFGLGAGPDRSGTAGAWAGANYVSATGAVSVIGTLNATWYITGVQFETGSVATPFERRPYGTELMLCQRYYYRMKATGTSGYFGSGLVDTTTNALFMTTFPVTMRTAPSALDQTGTATDYQVSAGGANTACSAVPVFAGAEVFSARTQFVVAAGLTVGQAILGRSATSAAYLGWSAEL